MSGRGLLSRLAAQGARPSPDELEESIVEHLRVLLNTRKGDSASAPGFGIVDFNDVVHVFPAGIQALQASIRATVLEYEPRLRSVSVRHAPGDDPLVLHFEITAQPAGKQARGILRFQTRLTPGGKAEVW